MLGLMQDWPLLIHRVIDHAAVQHGGRAVISRSVEGPEHRTTYGEIRARRPGLPIVLITGNPRALGDHDGEFPLVVKPITGRKLEEVIEREIDPGNGPGAEVIRLHPRRGG